MPEKRTEVVGDTIETTTVETKEELLADKERVEAKQTRAASEYDGTLSEINAKLASIEENK